MRIAKMAVRVVFGLLAFCISAGMAAAVDLTLTPFSSTFQTPIGIDFHEPTGKLIMSVNYPVGTPNNIDLVTLGTGAHVPFSSLSGLTNELKIATVRASACQGGFTVGEVFTGNGVFGEVVRISADGSTVQNPWVSLGGTDLIRGSLFQDRFCAAGGDLIVVTGNEQSDATSVGNVYRITSAGAATLIGTAGTHLEGVTTVPNLPLVYGPLAGRILAGAEDLTSSSTYNPNGRIYAFNPSPPHDNFTIGAGVGPACVVPYTAAQTGCNFATTTAFHPEDLDVIRRNADFFGVAFRDGEILTAPAANFDGRCGQVLVTQEFPFSNTSGLNALRWDSGTSSFIVDSLTSNVAVQQWEHVTFTSGQDCATTITIVKTPDNATFTIGQQLSFTLLVTNTGNLTALSAAIDDPLPTTGGLTWSVTSVSSGSYSIDASQVMHCDLGDMAPADTRTVVVTTNNAGGAPAASCTGDKIINTGTASATNAASVTDTGDYTCTPPPPPGGLIAPTQTTCQDFINGTAATLGQVNYSVSGGKIGQGINPGVFFYYTKITVPANTTVTVSESQNDAAALFQVHQGQARLYQGDCSSWTGGTLINNSTGASYSIATAGTYVISIKYDTKSIAGTTAPTSDPVTYTFTATPPGASSSASVLLKKQ
jgi:uncharacterized repeat protein (TIGR01451 family)